MYCKGTSIRQAPVFRHLRPLRKNPWKFIIWMNKLIILHGAGFLHPAKLLILPSQFWQIRFESCWLHCSKCRILVLLRYLVIYSGVSYFISIWDFLIARWLCGLQLAHILCFTSLNMHCPYMYVTSFPTIIGWENTEDDVTHAQHVHTGNQPTSVRHSLPIECAIEKSLLTCIYRVAQK